MCFRSLACRPTMSTWCPWVVLCVLAAYHEYMVPAATASAQRRAPHPSVEDARNRMVDEEVVGAGIKNPRVIQSMRVTPRHEFVPRKSIDRAYFDMSLPIGEGQTISPPMFVAYMTEQLDPQPDDRVLEIGTGSGYQAAVLSPLVKEVYSIEIVESLGKHAQQTLKRLKYANVFVKIGDGYLGWPEKAPFDKIIVTCSPEKVPQPLIDQLKEGGRMIIPVGERYQQVFHLLKKAGRQTDQRSLAADALRAHDRQGRGEPAGPARPAAPQVDQRRLRGITGSSGEPTGWYYIRQMKVVTAADAPEGRNYVTFSNYRARPRLPSAARLPDRRPQGPRIGAFLHGPRERHGARFARQSSTPACGPVLGREPRHRGTTGALGPWRGTFAWKRMTGLVKVPAARPEGIVEIGLLGGTGEVSYDDVQIRLPKAKLPAR